MAEFKVSDALKDEISAFRSAGSELGSAATKIEMGPGISTLKTGAHFVTEHNEIVDLMKLYQKLVAKDADELAKMKKAADDLDAKISRKVR